MGLSAHELAALLGSTLSAGGTDKGGAPLAKAGEDGLLAAFGVWRRHPKIFSLAKNTGATF